MPANPTPTEGVVAPLDPDFAEALIEKLTEIVTRDDLKGRHVVFNTEVRSIATIVGVAAKVIGRPLAARPAETLTEAATLIEAQAAEIEGLKAALEPFAAMATVGDQRPKDEAVWAGQDGKRITFGDFRRAFLASRTERADG